MWRSILEKILIVSHFIKWRHFVKFRSRAELEQWQQRHLKAHLQFVRGHSVFYRERLVEPWQTTPLIEKQDMMKHFDRLNTRELKRDEALQLALDAETSRNFSPMLGDVTVGLSSGTSGHRGLFCADFFERSFYAGVILAKALPKNSRGQQRLAFFMRANSNLYKVVRNRRLAFHFFDMLKPLDSHLAELKQVNPTLLIAPPSQLRQLADEILAGRLQLKAVERIYSVAEVLDPVDQAFIERAFHQKVHQIYQCTEGFLAISCEHGSLHLNEDLLIFEKEWLNEAEGKFMPILTDLNRRTQPIIRYRLNDILTLDPEPCACGSVLTRIKMIEGRCDDMLEFPKGENRQAVFPDFVRNAILFASHDIQEYRVTQKPNGDLSVALKGQGSIEALESSVRQQLQNLAAKLQCQLPTIHFEHEFPALEGRKLRRIIRQSAVVHLP